MPSESPFEPEELASVLLPMGLAKTLPGRAYTEPAVFAFEHDAWFSRDWLYVGRASDANEPGTWFVAPLTAAGVIIARDGGGTLRAFHNVCRHRGTPLLPPLCASGAGASQFRCPYHGWTYGLDGRLLQPGPAPKEEDAPSLLPVRLEQLGGFLFVSLAWDGPPLLDWLDDLPAQLEGIPLAKLAVGHATRTEVAANWKLIMENFAES